MSDTKGLATTLDFLRKLREHNDRGWFLANRARYEEARAAYETVVAELVSRFDAVDGIRCAAPKDCMFRINRDVRFSADKSPYKTGMGALLGPAGRKSSVRAYYFHVEPDGESMLAGGLYAPSASELAKVRAAIGEDAGPLEKIIGAAGFKRLFGGISGDSLKTAPQGYPRDHSAIELLRKKQFIAIHALSDADVVSPGLVPEALKTFKAMRPFLEYLEAILA